VTIVVHPSDPRFPRDQVEAARYYLAPRHFVVLSGDASDPKSHEQSVIYDAYCLGKQGNRSPEPGAKIFSGVIVKERKSE
jgi:hypothetical protein